MNETVRILLCIGGILFVAINLAAGLIWVERRLLGRRRGYPLYLSMGRGAASQGLPSNRYEMKSMSIWSAGLSAAVIAMMGAPAGAAPG